jgi:division protein CdvB (Snf7/Vps24/ESCRT-III family)
MCKGVESLDVEAASRRVLKELVSHYNKLDVNQTKRVTEVTDFGEATRERVDKCTIKIKKLENTVAEIADLRKKLLKQQSYMEEVQIRVERATEDL